MTLIKFRPRAAVFAEVMVKRPFADQNLFDGKCEARQQRDRLLVLTFEVLNDPIVNCESTTSKVSNPLLIWALRIPRRMILDYNKRDLSMATGHPVNK
jgi:hypothetical protein